MNIIFMGTPEFAVPSLEILLKNHLSVNAVVTAPDKPQGRGQVLKSSPVKNYAQANGIPVLQPIHLKDPAFLEEISKYRPDLQVVVAFRMLPEVVWSLAPRGTFNLHASLLPQYRGAAPINWAIINGETKTGLTTFFINHEIDKGNLILSQEEMILEDDTAGTLHDRLMVKGAELVLNTVRIIEKGDFRLRKQVELPDLKSAPKLRKEMCEINWNWDSVRIRNFVRGLSPYPAAWTLIRDKIFKIFSVSIEEDDLNYNVGYVWTDNCSFLKVQSAQGVINILELQAEGKRRMSVTEYLRGNKI